MAEDFTRQLTDYQELIQNDITKTATRLEADALQHFGDHGRDAIKAYTAILARGGKRLRGALVLVGYQMCGGKNVHDVLPIARAMEMLHAYLLVTDDVFDQSATRRGGPTAHVMLQGQHKSYKWRGDSRHFGESVASCTALIGCHQAMQEITDSPLSDSAKVAILRLVNHAIAVTAYGQVHDIFNEATQRVNEAQVEHTHIWKTAYYSFIGPLQAGAMAAGAPESTLKPLYEYGKHMGLAFQAADDLLGTFGNESQSGKSNADDIRDRKMTLLVAHLRHEATIEQKIAFYDRFTKPTLTDNDIIFCKDLLSQVGAADCVKNLAEKEARLAIDALAGSPANWGSEQLEFLRALASFVTRRSA